MNEKKLDELTKALIRLHVFHRADREFFSIIQTSRFVDGMLLDYDKNVDRENLKSVWSEKFRLPYSEMSIEHNMDRFIEVNGEGKSEEEVADEFFGRVDFENINSVYVVSDWLCQRVYLMGEPVLRPVSKCACLYWLSDYDFQAGNDDLYQHPILRAIAAKYSKELASQIEELSSVIEKPGFGEASMNAKAALEMMKNGHDVVADGEVFFTDVISTPWCEEIEVVLASSSQSDVPWIVCEADSFVELYSDMDKEFYLFHLGEDF